MTSTTNRDARERLGRQKIVNAIRPHMPLTLYAHGEGSAKPTHPDGCAMQDMADAILALLADQPLRGDEGSDQPLPSVATGHPEQGALLSGWRELAETAARALAEIPKPHNDGCHVVWLVGDDVPESIAVAQSYIAALLSAAPKPEGNLQKMQSAPEP